MASDLMSSSSNLLYNINSSSNINLNGTSNFAHLVSTDDLNALNLNSYFKGASNLPVAENTNLATELSVNSASINSPFTSGWFTVGSNGSVSVYFLVDDGAYEGELGIFNLEGMGQYELGSSAFIQEAARRAISNSTQGYVVISDRNEGALQSGTLAWDSQHNKGEYKGMKNFTMRSGEQFALLFVPNGTIQQVFNEQNYGDDKQPLFSIAQNNPLAASHVTLFRDLNGSGRIFAMEDIRSDRGTDKDFNDFVFYMGGAVGDVPSIDSLVDFTKNWRESSVAQELMKWQPSPPANIGKPTESPAPPTLGSLYSNGDLIKGSSDKVYFVEDGKRRWIPNSGIFQQRGFKRENIKSLSDEIINGIPFGDNLPILEKYQNKSNTTSEWQSDFYSWDGNGIPPIDFTDNNNKFASLNLGSNTRSDARKGIKFELGNGSPQGDSKLLNDNFVVRSYTQANFEKGKIYKATVKADDGYQLFAKNQATGEWVYFTPQNEWKTDAYGVGKEIEFQVFETSKYDLYFQYFEAGGDAYFDLRWEEAEIKLPVSLYKNGDLVKGSDNKVYLIEANKKRWISNDGIFIQRGFKREDIKSLSDETINGIVSADNLQILDKYKQSANTSTEWQSDFYWWNVNTTPSIDFFNNSNNKFASLNLGSNTISDGKKGINFELGKDSPQGDAKLLNDNFVIRSYTQANFEKGKTYNAKVKADDGYQLLAKNKNTGKWVYFTKQNEWEIDAYGFTKEIEFKVPESGLYDFYFQYFERDGDAYFDLTWEAAPIELVDPTLENDWLVDNNPDPNRNKYWSSLDSDTVFGSWSSLKSLPIIEYKFPFDFKIVKVEDVAQELENDLRKFFNNWNLPFADKHLEHFLNQGNFTGNPLHLGVPMDDIPVDELLQYVPGFQDVYNGRINQVKSQLTQYSDRLKQEGKQIKPGSYWINSASPQYDWTYVQEKSGSDFGRRLNHGINLFEKLIHGTNGKLSDLINPSYNLRKLLDFYNAIGKFEFNNSMEIIVNENSTISLKTQMYVHDYFNFDIKLDEFPGQPNFNSDYWKKLGSWGLRFGQSAVPEILVNLGMANNYEQWGVSSIQEFKV
jgi:Domain of unknown function (DUF4114)